MKHNLMTALILGFLLVGCAKEKKETNIQSELVPFIKAFETQSQNVGDPVTVDNLDASIVPSLAQYVLGQCNSIGSGGRPEIQISQLYWNYLGPKGREELMFHELGHCVLNRVHRADMDNQQLPMSIMNPYFFSSDLYLANYAQYLHELFFQRDIVGSITNATTNTNAMVYKTSAYSSSETPDQNSDDLINPENIEETISHWKCSND